MKVPVSKIGELQKQDIERSKGIVYYDDYARICTVIKDGNDREDKSPYRLYGRLGGNWEDYNNHFIIQVAGCPLNCWYCYVDNFEPDIEMTAKEIVDKYENFRIAVKYHYNVNVRVLHLMGGCPGRYPQFWRELSNELINRDYRDTILFTDVIFVENYFYNVKPWDYMTIPNLVVAGCLKGTSKNNFIQNTGKNLFKEAVYELAHYVHFDNFYLTVIGQDDCFMNDIYKIVKPKKVDKLKIVNYIASGNKI